MSEAFLDSGPSGRRLMAQGLGSLGSVATSTGPCTDVWGFIQGQPHCQAREATGFLWGILNLPLSS